MGENLKEFVQELEKCQETYEIERWQLRVKSYLDEAYGNKIANKFQSLNFNDNPWDGSASQRGYLEALLAKKKSSNISEGPVTLEKPDRDINRAWNAIRVLLQQECSFYTIKEVVGLAGLDLSDLSHLEQKAGLRVAGRSLIY